MTPPGTQLETAETASGLVERAFVRHSKDRSLPPTVILGGEANALSIARSLGTMGVSVYALNKSNAHICYSRFAEWIPLPANTCSVESWADFLLSGESDHLRGAVLLAACDDALTLLVNYYNQLKEKYRLDICAPAAQIQMLDKLSTYRIATEAGVITPQYWAATTIEEVERIESELTFPLLIKPGLTHLFAARFGKKFLIANNLDELRSSLEMLEETSFDLMLVELIPGGDDLLCSYYTYLDEDGKHLFHFTKRIVRRFPPGMGIASHHITDHIEALAEPAAKLFAHVGLRGLANVEFKLDPRDGQLKLIECNARFTAANILLQRCGYDLARFVYNRIIGAPLPEFKEYPAGVRLWRPVDDFRAFVALHRQGEISFADWFGSAITPGKVSAFFDWRDPMPAIRGQLNRVGKLVSRRRQTPDK